MRFLHRAAILAALLLSSVGAFAQGAVKQSGPATVGHGACWAANGVVRDCGVAVPGPSGPYLPLTGGDVTGPVTGLSFPVLQATNYGVTVNTGTSQDVALYNALAACTAAGATLILPPGVITLTSVVVPTLQNCNMEGAGIPSALAGFSKPGTLIELTGHAGTASTPGSYFPPVFIVGKGWRVAGMAFYWPNQTGTILYPPLLSDNNSSPTNRGLIENVAIMNAYDGIVQNDTQWGDIKLVNVTIWSAHDDFRVSSVGDGLSAVNLKRSPGPWLGICGSCNGPVGLMSNTGTMFHVLAPTAGTGGFPLNIAAVNLLGLGARYGFKLESGAVVAETQVNGIWDAVGSIIDSSAGGLWSAGNNFTGQNAACYIPGTTWGAPATGNEPCFNMGSTGELDLDNFQSGGTQGDFIKTTGAAVFLTNSVSYNIGSAVDGGDYYQVNYASSGSGQIRMQNNQLGGINNSAHVHGFGTTSSGVPSTLVFQGNTCQFLNDCSSGNYPVGANFTGNTSFGTKAGSHSFAQSNSNGILYNNNNFDIPPAVTLGACGTGCSFNGTPTPNAFTINLGTGTVTSAAFTLPIVMYGRCIVTSDAAVAIGVVASGSPATTFTASFVDINGFHLFVNCPGT